MKVRFWIVVTALVMSLSGTRIGLAADAQVVEAEVNKAVHDMVAAYGGGQAMLESYFSFYADDVTIIRGASGRWDKAGYYTHWKEVNAQNGGVAAAEVQDLRIQVSPSGDAAVTTFLMPVTRKFPGGVVPPGQDANPNITWNMSEVWFRESGKWKVKSLTYVMAKSPG